MALDATDVKNVGQSPKENIFEFFRNGTLTDVLVKTTSGSFGAHKIVLMAMSAKCRRIFSGENGRNIPEITIMSKCEELVKPVIECMYTHELTLDSQNLSLYYLEIAYLLEMPLGIHLCKKYLLSLDKAAISVLTAVELWTLSNRFDDNDLRHLALDAMQVLFQLPTMKEQIIYVSLLEMDKFLELMSAISSRLPLHTLFTLTMLWITHDFPNRESLLPSMWSSVRKLSLNIPFGLSLSPAPRTPDSGNVTPLSDISPADGEAIGNVTVSIEEGGSEIPGFGASEGGAALKNGGRSEAAANSTFRIPNALNISTSSHQRNTTFKRPCDPSAQPDTTDIKREQIGGND